jgi:hypothetical protein
MKITYDKPILVAGVVVPAGKPFETTDQHQRQLGARGKVEQYSGDEESVVVNTDNSTYSASLISNAQQIQAALNPERTAEAQGLNVTGQTRSGDGSQPQPTTSATITGTGTDANTGTQAAEKPAARKTTASK